MRRDSARGASDRISCTWRRRGSCTRKQATKVINRENNVRSVGTERQRGLNRHILAGKGGETMLRGGDITKRQLCVACLATGGGEQARIPAASEDVFVARHTREQGGK